MNVFGKIVGSVILDLKI